MNQTQYADLFGVGRFSTISSWEVGDNEAPYKIIFRVLKELELFNLFEQISDEKVKHLLQTTKE